MIVFGNCDSTTTSSPSLVTPSEPPSLKMGDLEDLNRTLYDIGAQDLLDVWDAMETENEANTNGNSLGIGNSGLNSMMLSLSNQQSGEATPIVLKDRLLTDSVVFSEDFPSINCSNNGITTNSNVVSHASQNNCVNSNASISSGSSEHSYSSGTSVSITECQTTFSGTTSKTQTMNTTNKICSSNASQMWGTAAGSDGDSMPESPLSLDDDMETECYPCIPMQSATNQKSSVTIKNEPLSEGEDDGDDEEEDDDNHFVNVVDDSEESAVNRQQRAVVTQIRTPSSLSGSRKANKKTLTSQNCNGSINNNYNNTKFNVSLLASTPSSSNIENGKIIGNNTNNGNNNVFFVKKQSNVSYVSAAGNPLIATVVTHNGETKVTPRTSSPIGSLLATSTATTAGKVRMQQIQQQKCVRLTRSKHPQSLLKHQQPVAPTAQSSTTAILVTPISTGNIITTTCTGDKTIASGQSVHSNSFTIPTTSVVSRGQNLRSTTTGATNSSGYITSSYNSAPLNIGCLKIKTENDFVQPQSSGLPSNPSSYSRAVIHSSLISNQPTDGTSGILYLTDEEKKTLMSEGYPIPTKLPLTKAEEKSLKKIRRKIKNKISAQESRRKKKEFVDTLEQKVSLASAEVDAYKKKCELLQKQNASLMTQLNNLRAMLVNQSTTSSPTVVSCGGVTNILSTSKTISSNTLSISNNNGIKTEPAAISTSSIKIEPDCLDSVLSPGLDLD